MSDRAAAAQWFATRAKDLREAAGMTQNDVAHWSGLDVGEISRLESGLRVPQLWTLIRIARVFQRTPSEFLDGLR